MASTLVPRIIVLALGAGALGFPDALRVLRDVAGRSPLTDIAICVFAIAVVTANALGAMLLARFVRKPQRAGGDAPGAPPRRTDRFAQMTLAVSLGVACLVSACLVADAGAGLGPLYLAAADVARKMKSPVAIAALATGAAALPCARPLLRVFHREEDRSRPAGTARFASMTQATSFTAGAAAFFLVAVSCGVYAGHGFLVGVGTVVVGIGTALLLARSTFARTARNAAGAGGRVAPAPAADTRRLGGRLTRLAPYLAVVAFAALLCCLVLTTYAPLEREADGAKDP